MKRTGFISFDKDAHKVDTPKKAIYFSEKFMEKEGFCSKQFFCISPAKSYSFEPGYLRYLLLAAEHNVCDLIKEAEREQCDTGIALKFTALYVNKFGEKPPFIPWPRYLEIDNCAKIVTENIYNAIKDNNTNRFDFSLGDCLWDIDNEDVNESFIGRKWIVAFEYEI